MLETLSRLWCRFFHGAPLLPYMHVYTCPRCLREWRCPWA